MLTSEILLTMEQSKVKGSYSESSMIALESSSSKRFK